MSERFYDCPICGEVGRFAELRDHPTRPVPDDIGFCPHCGAEMDDEAILTEPEVRVLIENYGDDWQEFLATLSAPGAAA